MEMAATTFERQLAAFDVHSKTSRSSSSSGNHKSSGQHTSVSRHHSSGPDFRKSSSSGHHSSSSRHSSTRSSQSSSGSKSIKPETEAVHKGKSSHEKDGNKTSHKHHEDDKTSRKRHRSSSKSSGSKKGRLSEEKVEVTTATVICTFFGMIRMGMAAREINKLIP